MTILLTIEIEGGNLGPFDLYSNTDGYTNPFATNITKAALEAGYTSTSVPPDTTTVQVKSVGNCSNSIDIVLENTTTTSTTTTVPIVPCNGTSDSGGAGLKDIYVNLDPVGGVITFLFDPQGAADKMEFYHGLPQDYGINKVATTSQSASEDFGGNYGPFDDEYGTPPAPIIFPNNPTTGVDQFIGTLKGTVPTRQSEYTSDTGCTIPSMTIGSVTYDQVIWWRYDAADYLANPLVTIRITGSGDNTLWNSIRICNVCTTTTTTTATPTTTTTSSSTSTSTSTSTSSTSTSTSTSSSTTTTTTTTPAVCNSWYYNVTVYNCDCIEQSNSLEFNGAELNIGSFYYSSSLNGKILVNSIYAPCDNAGETIWVQPSSESSTCEAVTCPTTTTTTTATPTTTTTTTACVNRPVGLTNGNVVSSCNNQYFTPWNFTASAAEACDAFSYFRSNPITTGSGVSYSSMQYDTLAIGQKIYLGYNGTNCSVVQNGNYWFQPDNTDVTPYFKNINTIDIVTIVSGVITNINSCNYVEPPLQFRVRGTDNKINSLTPNFYNIETGNLPVIEGEVVLGSINAGGTSLTIGYDSPNYEPQIVVVKNNVVVGNAAGIPQGINQSFTYNISWSSTDIIKIWLQQSGT